MRRAGTWILVWSLACLVGCTTGFQDDGFNTAPSNGGDDDDDDNGGGGGGGDAAALFAPVEEALRRDCARCHANTSAIDGPDYLDPDDYHASLVANPRIASKPSSQALLITIGTHTGSNGLLGADLENAKKWMDNDPAVQGSTTGGDGGPVAADEVAALTRFATCMTRQDWEDTEMDEVAELTTTGGQCYSCHEVGQYDTFLSLDQDKTFEMSRKAPYVRRFVAWTQGKLQAYPRFYGKAISEQQNDAADAHPDYSPEEFGDEDGRVNLDEFIRRTLERANDKTIDCGPPPAP